MAYIREKLTADFFPLFFLKVLVADPLYERLELDERLVFLGLVKVDFFDGTCDSF